MPRATPLQRLTATEARFLLQQGKGWPSMRVDGVLAFKDAGKVPWPPHLEVEVLDLLLPLDGPPVLPPRASRHRDLPSGRGLDRGLR
jgi:hypothetical protein